MPSNEDLVHTESLKGGTPVYESEDKAGEVGVCMEAVIVRVDESQQGSELEMVESIIEEI